MWRMKLNLKVPSYATLYGVLWGVQLLQEDFEFFEGAVTHRFF
jgi:hypothetical protein